jgi:hypothetical protein
VNIQGTFCEHSVNIQGTEGNVLARLVQLMQENAEEATDILPDNLLERCVNHSTER